MKLINNRYKINGILKNETNSEEYLVNDLMDKDNIKKMRIFNKEKDSKISSFFIENFLILSQIRHKNILSSEHFGVVETINLKKTNKIIHYLVTGYCDWDTLASSQIKLDLSHRLKLLLEIMNTVDYIHFRGFILKYLSPSNIYSSGDEIRIQAITRIIENSLKSYYGNDNGIFIAPEVLMNNGQTNYKADYFSVGLIMKQLLIEDINLTKSNYNFIEGLALNRDEKNFLSDIIDNLTRANPMERNISLRRIIDDINSRFHLGLYYDLVDERNKIFLNTPLIGSKKELEELLALDDAINEGANEYKAIVIKGGKGIGKSKLLKEFGFRLKMRGKAVYRIDLSDTNELGLISISRLIKMIVVNQPESIVNRYLSDFEALCSYTDRIEANLNFKNSRNKYNLFNKICNFINEITREETIYLQIKNFDKANKDFVDLIDYLFSYLTKNSLFMLFSLNDNENNSSYALDKINSWTSNKLIKVFIHNPLTLEETGKLIKNILGISYVPIKFSQEIFNESKGRPSFIEFFIKDMYDNQDIYMHSEGYWELKNKDLSQMRFPATYSEMIDNKLKKYDERTLSVIKVLSIFNTKVTKSEILQLTGLEPNSLDEVIDVLISDKVIDENASERDNIYGLVSDELSRISYQRIDEQEKIRLHTKAADILLELYSSNLYHIRNELIYHLDKANKVDEALALIIRDAEKIVDKSSPSAIMLWELGYSLAENTIQKEKLIILDNLTYVYMLKGDIEKTDYYNEKLFAEAIDMDNIKYHVKAMVYMAEGLIRKNQLDQLESLIGELESISIKSNFIEGTLEALILKARLLNGMGEIKGILPILREALEVSEKHGIKSYLGTIYNLQGIAYNNLGNIGDSIEAYKKSISMYEYSEYEYDVIKPINNLGNIYSDNFDINRSMEYYEEALNIAKKYGLIRLINIFLNNIGESYYDKLEYNKSIEYLEEASKLAEDGKDIRMKFTSDINLGFIDLNTNKLGNAYELFKDLEILNVVNPIQEGEIKYKYITFMGEFYLQFGNYELAKKYTEIACEYYKEFNIKEWLKTESRLISINFLKTGLLDRKAIYTLIECYLKTDFNHDYLRFLLDMAKLALINSEREFSWELIDSFKEVIEKVDSIFLNFNFIIIERLLKGDEDSLLEIEKSLGSEDIDLYISSIFDLRLYLGNIYHERKKYSKALRQYLEAMDNLYTTSYAISDSDIKLELINSKNPEIIKERIVSILMEGYKKDISNIKIEKVTFENLSHYFDISPFTDLLSSNEFYEIFHYEDKNIEIKSLNDLLLNLDDNYKENLKTILKFLGNEMIASRGLVIVLDSENNTTEVVASIIPGDKKMPNDFILLNALRSKNHFIFNRSLASSNNKSIEGLMINSLEGMICIPITAHPRYVNDNLDRRKWETIQNNELVGYVYLETTSSLNRFDLKRYELAQSLINILYLNVKNDSLKRISISDKVTGTYTRKHFEDRFDLLMDYYKRTENSFSLLMIDIDKFKQVNDTYGHQKGDKVLSMLGSVISDSIRESDLVGRYGGEEFIVILNNTTTESGMEVADKIRANVENMKVPGIDNRITVSIGISQFPLHSTFSDELIAKADQALYYAKEILGRNKIALWYPGMSGANNNFDKLTGIITGDLIKDNNNLLALVDISELLKDNKSYEDKVYDFLGRIVESVNGEYASLIMDKDYVLTRERDVSQFIETQFINYCLVDEVNTLKEGKYSIDWENSELKDEHNYANWSSILAVPLIKNDEVKATVYITVPLKEKEFDDKDLGICSILSNIFVGNI